MWQRPVVHFPAGKVWRGWSIRAGSLDTDNLHTNPPTHQMNALTGEKLRSAVLVPREMNFWTLNWRPHARDSRARQAWQHAWIEIKTIWAKFQRTEIFTGPHLHTDKKETCDLKLQIKQCQCSEMLEPNICPDIFFGSFLPLGSISWLYILNVTSTLKAE